MRKAKRCVWVLIGFSILCAAYFLLVLHDERYQWMDNQTMSKVRQAMSQSEYILSNTKEYYSNCPVDHEFAAAINNTAYGNPLNGQMNNIVYVSVPKCGSRTFVWIAWNLKDKKNFTSIIDLPYLLDDSNELEMRNLMSDKLASVPRTGFFHGHVRFIQFTDPSMMPVYISMLRDPLSRHISWYYFMRYGDSDMDAKELHEIVIASEGAIAVNETYDECVENKRSSCTSPYYTNINIKTFCGYEKRCHTSPQFALEQAKRNLDRFVVVGIIEEYESTLRVIERLLPSKFGGALKEYKSNKEQFSSVSKTAFKKMPSAKNIAIMKERMKLDYEFYDFVKERFHKLKNHLGIARC